MSPHWIRLPEEAVTGRPRISQSTMGTEDSHFDFPCRQNFADIGHSTTNTISQCVFSANPPSQITSRQNTWRHAAAIAS